MEHLYDKLLTYSKTDYYAFHMPGHKRNPNLMGCALPYEIDITEIDGFDDLHHARDILKEAQERAARLYRAEETCYLINGSTAGILSAVMGCTSKGDRILVARNCHKSVYHAIYMNELDPVYLYPKFYDEIELNGPIDPLAVREALREQEGIKAVVITSPTYDGVVSDVEAIAGIVHEKGIPLIVDEAHGAHFGLHPYFPQNSNVKGADVVIHSLHKTLPSLTQTALIHMNGDRADRRRIRQYLHMLQTSSPSYVLMAGMDECIRMFLGEGSKCLQPYVDLLEETRKRLRGLKHLSLVETEHYDRSKLVISVKGTSMTGRELYQLLLEKYHLQMEMAAGSYVLAMTSVGDTREGMNRLASALEEMDAEIDSDTGTGYFVTAKRSRETAKLAESESPEQQHFSLPKLKRRYTSAELDYLLMKKSYDGEKKVTTTPVSWKEGVGKISTEYAYIYPPGIPLVVPGEEISREAAEILDKYESMGFSIEGPVKNGKIEVLING